MVTTISRHHETRGALYFLIGCSEYREEGWFRLSDDGRTVVMRKVGGRNRAGLVSPENVTLFVPHEKGEQA